jgi:hypothetical protein
MVDSFRSSSRKVRRTALYGLILISSLAFVSCSSMRTLERSSKKKPAWVHGLEKDHIITTGKGTDHEAAKASALRNLKESIINSIAVQVVSTTNVNTTESTEEIDDFIEVYQNNIEVNSEYFEPLKGISLLKANDFYWERVKENGVQSIIYHVKYPFSSGELAQLVSNFEQLSLELEAKLDEIVVEPGKYESLEMIVEDIRRLEYLAAILSKSKRIAAENKIERLEEILYDVNLRKLQDSSGYLVYGIYLYGDPINTYKLPEVAASCPIKVENIRSYSDRNEIFYDKGQCNLSQEHKLEVLYRFGDYKIRRNFMLPAADKDVVIKEVSQITLNSENLSGGDWRFEIETATPATFKLTQVRMYVGQIGKSKRFPVNFYKLQKEVGGRGKLNFVLPYDAQLNSLFAIINSNLTGKQYEASGEIHYLESGQERVYHFRDVPVDISL